MADILVLANDYTTLLHFRMELLSKLISIGHKVVISLPAHELNKAFVKLGCRVENISLDRFGMNPLRDFRLLLQYLFLIRRLKTNIVLTYTAKPNIYGGIACRLCHVPYICNVTGLGANFQSENLIKRLMLSLQKIAYRKATRVFFQNGSNLRYFADRRIVTKNAEQLPGSGVNLVTHSLEPYPALDGKIRFITVSRVRQDKGFDELFAAIRTCSKVYNNLEFHLAGWYEDDTYREKIERITAECPVIYHGSVSQEEVHRLISNCHCLILPSYHEGMANTLLEAAAAGRPCLASDIPGCREAVEDGVTGSLFKVKDADSLRDAILSFIRLPDELKQEMGQEGRKKMESEFDRRFVVDKYLETIDDALKGAEAPVKEAL